MGGMVGRGRSVLIVEDDRLTLSLLAETLIQAGFVVGAAANASEARRLWSSMDADAVVLDVDLGPVGAAVHAAVDRRGPAATACRRRPLVR